MVGLYVDDFCDVDDDMLCKLLMGDMIVDCSYGFGCCGNVYWVFKKFDLFYVGFILFFMDC